MEWIGILVVSPLWGVISTQLFFQAWLGVAGFLIGLFGFVKGAVPRESTAILIGMAIFSTVLYSLLLSGGFWLLTNVFSFGYSRTENIVYWVFAGLSTLFILLKLPARLRKIWRNAMDPGSLEIDILKRKIGLNPDVE